MYDHCLHTVTYLLIVLEPLNLRLCSEKELVSLKPMGQQHGTAEEGNNKGETVPPGSEFDIKCPSLCLRILISSHGDCPTVLILRVVDYFTQAGALYGRVVHCHILTLTSNMVL